MLPDCSGSIFFARFARRLMMDGPAAAQGRYQ
jgi:hypothetical protein